MFSGRTQWNLDRNPLADRVSARRAALRPFLDLTETNPTRAGLQAPLDALAPLSSRDALAYDPQPAGLLAAREAVATDFARRGRPVSADRVVLSASTSEAYAWLFKLLCDPGDDVLVPRPSYPLFEYLAGLESVRAVPYLLGFDGEWHLHGSALESALTPRTRAVVVVSPNNPTGSFLKRDEADALAGFAACHGLAVISDEVFCDFAFGPDPRRAGSFAQDGPALAFALGGLSKSCGLPQLKLGWTAVSGPAPLRDEALRRLEVVADTYLSVGTPVQVAAPHLLARLPELQGPIAARVARNAARLRELAGTGTAVTALSLEGGWTAVLRLPAVRSEESWVLGLLDESDVLVHPGFFFDIPGEAFVVLSLLPPPHDFDEGLQRLLDHVRARA